MLSQERIEATLTSEVIGRQLVYLPVTSSTNTVAKELAREGAPDGTVVVADEQSAGRGRLGRRWLAPSGTSILCSILFRPELPLDRALSLMMICSLAAADAIAQVSALQPAPKWPNDLIVEDGRARWRKLAGLLTETGVSGDRLEYVIVGIGVNVNIGPNELPALAPDATSVLAETGQPVDRAALLAVLLAEADQRYRALRAGESPYGEWAGQLATLGRLVQAVTPTGVITGMAEHVDPSGALFLRTGGGVLHRLQVGDVTLVPVEAT